jgi:undecaprenyl diphosphate synthase
MKNLIRKKTTKSKTRTPTCIGIIMDGNRRWAKKRGLPAFLGHTEGYKKFKEFVGWAQERNIKYLVAYAFSTENWKRSNTEVNHLVKLLNKMLDTEIGSLKERGIRVRFIGDLARFPENIVQKIRNAEQKTAHASGINLIIALSYGGRAEIVAAIKKLNDADVKHLTEEHFSEFLFTKGIPDPDLIIRTGGEMRLSNFLLWQSAYSELFFSKTYWPDFTKKEFFMILEDFSSRERRIGT